VLGDFDQLTSLMNYNPRGLLSSLSNTYNGSLRSNFLGVAYDAVGNRTRIGTVDIEPILDEYGWVLARGMNGSLTYTMDITRRRLLTEAFSQSDYQIPSYSLPFAYDPSDNLTSVRGTTFSHNANSQVTNSGFGYDVNGNATLFNYVAHNYDYENRVLQAGSILADYRPDGKRAWKQPGALSTRTYYLYDGERVIFEFNPTNGFYQAYAYGANGLACSERQGEHLMYAFDPAGNLVHRFRDGTVLSNSWFDSYGGLFYDDSQTGQRPYPSPDSVGYQGQWGAYTDIESRNYAQYLRWVFVDGDYYHPLTGNFLTRRSAGTNEYSAGVNPTTTWGRVIGGTLAGIAGGILTGGNPLGIAAGVALFEGLYSAAEGKPASVVVRDAVVSGALAYVGGRFLPQVESAAAQMLVRQGVKQAAREFPGSLSQALPAPRKIAAAWSAGTYRQGGLLTSMEYGFQEREPFRKRHDRA